MLKVGFRYGANLVAMVAQQEGYAAAVAAGGRFVKAEALKLPRVARLALERRDRPRHPTMYSAAIAAAIADLGVEVKLYNVDVSAFRAHLTARYYPRNYAAGPIEGGGMREQKVLEYFVSLDLLDVHPSDVVVDVASEWSIFPDVLRKLTGATVYRQDLIYAAGIRRDRIGGSAANMPVPDRFADKIVLHNAFEHFEGTADSDFIVEAGRVLKPGGVLCILPLFVSDCFCNITDPLVRRPGIAWDSGARVIELPWWHNRFGRFYDAAALLARVLAPAAAAGFDPTIYHVVNVSEAHPRAHLHFALVLRKRTRSGPGELDGRARS
jgi:SAM-dependent methyltransferase